MTQINTISVVFHCYSSCTVSPVSGVILSSLVHRVAHGSQRVVSPPVLLKQTEMFCCILKSSSVIPLWLSQQNTVSVSSPPVGPERGRTFVYCLVCCTPGLRVACTPRVWCSCLEAGDSSSLWACFRVLLSSVAPVFCPKNFFRPALTWTMTCIFICMPCQAPRNNAGL